MAQTLTRAERLNACLSRLSPELRAMAASGQWPASGAPYVIQEAKNGKRRIVINDPVSGDMYVGVGPTVEDALTNLEQKLDLLIPEVQ